MTISVHPFLPVRFHRLLNWCLSLPLGPHTTALVVLFSHNVLLLSSVETVYDDSSLVYFTLDLSVVIFIVVSPVNTEGGLVGPLHLFYRPYITSCRTHHSFTSSFVNMFGSHTKPTHDLNPIIHLPRTPQLPFMNFSFSMITNELSVTFPRAFLPFQLLLRLFFFPSSYFS